MGNQQHDPDKERVFVRALTGAYSLKQELDRLRSLPRVIKGKDLKLDGGPQHFSRHYVEPEDGRMQTLHIHLEEYAPGGKTQKPGHVNEADVRGLRAPVLGLDIMAAEMLRAAV